MYVRHMHAGTLRGHKRALISLELELQMALTLHVGAGNQACGSSVRTVSVLNCISLQYLCSKKKIMFKTFYRKILDILHVGLL